MEEEVLDIELMRPRPLCAFSLFLDYSVRRSCRVNLFGKWGHQSTKHAIIQIGDEITFWKAHYNFLQCNVWYLWQHVLEDTLLQYGTKGSFFPFSPFSHRLNLCSNLGLAPFFKLKSYYWIESRSVFMPEWNPMLFGKEWNSSPLFAQQKPVFKLLRVSWGPCCMQM